MKIGLDVDGVLAAFIPAYIDLYVEVTGKNLFDPGDRKDPPCWNFDTYRGYTKEEQRKVWKVIKESHDFWTGLRETSNVPILRLLILDLLRNHDVYFITNRSGRDAKWQTELWLRLHLAIDQPTVLISAKKGLCAAALSLDCYIDDNADNCNDVEVNSPETRIYLLDASYNRPGGPENVGVYALVTRVKTLGEFFDAELTRL